MNLRILFIVVFLGLALNTRSQSYNFNLTTGDYSDLINSTSLNNGLTWDDPQFEIPLGFNFVFFDITFDKLYIEDIGLGALLTNNISEEGAIPLLVPYGADIIDRGYDIDGDGATPTSLSNISYLLEGTPGSQILKIEWKNVGFYNELAEDGVSSDFTNFQLWLYEGTNDIEIHFGNNSITQADLCFDGESGTSVALINEYDYDNDLFSEGLILEGNPSSPDLITFINPASGSYLNGVIPNGTIYKFSKSTVGVSELQSNIIDIQMYPNPSNNYLTISTNNLKHQLNTVSILNINGQMLKKVRYNKNAIDISDLSMGIYIVEIRTTEGMVMAKKLVKE